MSRFDYEMNMQKCLYDIMYSTCIPLYTLFIPGNEIVPDNCKHGGIRLVSSGNKYSGNVEVCINGVWSLICDSGWSSNDAKVACAQAGYPGPGRHCSVPWMRMEIDLLRQHSLAFFL